MLPALGYSSGCLSLRLLLKSFIVSLITSGFPCVNCILTERIISPVCIKLLIRWPSAIFSAGTCKIMPSFVITAASVTTCFSSPPYAPAFINRPPPIVPGIPAANSRPVSPADSAACDTAGSDAPASAVIVLFSRSTSILLKCFRKFTITPSKPLSLTSRLLPRPRIKHGTCNSLQIFKITRSCCSSCGAAIHFAGPPTRKVV